MTRTEVINYLIEKYNFKSYLEIGVQYPDSNYKKINVETKVGVEPFPLVDMRGLGVMEVDSDKFFDSIAKDKTFDIVFIDGLHTREQCLRDILNSLNHLNEGGVILVHDCLPTQEYQTTHEDNGREWTGDVWKSIVDIQSKNDIEACTIDTDWGIGFIRKKPTDNPNQELELMDLDWSTYESMRNQLLNIKTIDQWINFL
jgi:hypothetical protein